MKLFYHRQCAGGIIELVRKKLSPQLLTALAFLAVIAVFVFVRLPIFNAPLEVELHGDKYATHIPTVQNMYRQKTPFYNRNQNYISILNSDPDLSFKAFEAFPLVEWSLLPFMFLTRFLSLEVVIRGAQTFYGIILLWLLFRVLTRSSSPIIALAITMLLAINPVVQLLTLLTTRDLPALIFLLAAIYAWQSKRGNLAFLLTGFAVLSKYSFLLIALPLFTGLIFLYGKNKLYSLLKLLLFSFTPWLLFNWLVKRTPSTSFTMAGVNLFLFLLGIGLIYRVVKKFDQQLFRLYLKIPPVLRFLMMGIILLMTLLLLKDKVTSFSANFLTDRYLIFNWPMYRELLRQNADLCGVSVSFYWLVVSFAVFLSAGNACLSAPQRMKGKLAIGLLLAAASYLILASKSIFEHFYYRHIFVLLFYFSLAEVVCFWYKKQRDTLALTLVVVSLTLFLFPLQLKSTTQFLQANPPVYATKEVGKFLDEQLVPGEKVLGKDNFNIYSQRTVVDPADISWSDKVTLAREINDLGLKAVLVKHKIRFLLTERENDFDYLSQLLLFSDDQADISERTRLILDRTQTAPEPQIEPKDQEQLLKTIEAIPRLKVSLGGWFVYQL